MTAKAQAQVSDYHDFVIRNLVGIEGTSHSDVTARIIGFWIRENQEWLDKLGLSIDAWRRSGTGAQPGNVISYETKRAKRTSSTDQSVEAKNDRS